MTESPALLVVMALAQEAQSVFQPAGIPVLYTGLGKVNAAMNLTRHLSELRSQGNVLPMVVNFGSAGSGKFNTGSLVACTNFVQRDMDVSALGFVHGTTPFEDLPAAIEYPNMFANLPIATCGTGDSFETGTPKVLCDVVDMEAYALAKVCRLEGVQFACVKFISDGADHAAARDWQDNAHRAADEFLRLYRILQSGRRS
jgi:adenosylhomocysteine nucleosidase